jgi:hypothetical protein
MSTTEDLAIVIRYARGDAHALILRLGISSFMTQGAHLSWLSCFPHEQQLLYPPLTLIRPLPGKRSWLRRGGTLFTVVEAEPHFPS